MDLETENRIAAILMKEAAELRRQAERDGVDACLRPHNMRGRPNSRFLTATVLGIQQANRVVEVNEMWRIRRKEKELDDKRSTNNASSFQRHTSTTENCERKSSSLCSSSKRGSEDDGLRDQEIEEFLHSRVKRGRGAVGSRMDETGPYLPGCEEKHLARADEGYRENWDNRIILGAERPINLKPGSSSDEESSGERERTAKRHCSRKRNRREHSSEDMKKKKKKKKREKKSRQHN